MISLDIVYYFTGLRLAIAIQLIYSYTKLLFILYRLAV